MDKSKVTKWIAPCVTARSRVPRPPARITAFVASVSKSGYAPFMRFPTAPTSFTVPGVVLCGIALLGWIGTFGQFDMLSYGSRKFFGHFVHSLSDELPDHFYEYREMRNEQGRDWNKRPLWVGLVCLACAVLSLVLYYVL